MNRQAPTQTSIWVGSGSPEQSLALKPDKASEGCGGEQPLDDIHVGKHSHQASNLARMRQDNRLKLATDGSVAYPRSIALSSLGKRPAPLRSSGNDCDKHSQQMHAALTSHVIELSSFSRKVGFADGAIDA
jgi:hypothetical protein